MASAPVAQADGADPQGWLGRTVGAGYRLERLIGRGGVGAVFAAESADGQRYAVKILDRAWARDEIVAGRFAREARVAGAVASPHIVRVVDGGTEDGCPYLVMDLVPGEDLGARLRRRRVLPIDEAIAMTEQLLSGLAAAHAAGVVHRDLKPDNVLLSEGDDGATFVTLVDFGMSKIEPRRDGTAQLPLTRAGTVLGTPLYVSPEQARGQSDVDARSDVYAAGAILFECLTGRPPHTGETHEQVLLRICMDDAPDVRRWAPEVPGALAALIARALARERDARFATAEAMLTALRGERSAGGEAGDVQRARRRARARLAAAAVIAMIAGAAAALLAVALAGK